jgi:hypothetical protein
MSDLAARAAGTVWQWRRRDSGGDAARKRAAAAARVQGLIGLGVGLTVAAVLRFWLGHPRMALVVAGISVALALIALLSPTGVQPKVAAALQRFGRLVGTAVTWVLMTLTYALLFVPVGLFLRATGKLRLQKAYDARRASYWQPAADRPPSLDRYRRQF